MSSLVRRLIGQIAKMNLSSPPCTGRCPGVTHENSKCQRWGKRAMPFSRCRGPELVSQVDQRFILECIGATASLGSLTSYGETPSLRHRDPRRQNQGARTLPLQTPSKRTARL
jgi:hypothetical protein